MKRLILPAGACALAFLATTTSAATAPVMDDAARQSYALGYRLGRDLAGTEIRNEALIEGLTDGRSGADAKLAPEQMQAALASLEQSINARRAKEQAAAAETAAAAGTAYLADNAQREGVTTTASGLQYKVIKPGTGRSPTVSDSVTVHYRGTLVDGKQFDSSYDRGEPATFPVNGVIAGWTEALQLMKEGDKWKLTIPPQLAYGERGAGKLIPPNSTLVFEVELIKVN